MSRRQQASTTVYGRVGQNPEQTTFDNGDVKARFGVAVNDGWFNDRNEWVELPPTWFNVRCSGDLARHVMMSVRRGQPVIVSGHLTTEAWTDKDGQPREHVVLRAGVVGHDLRLGVTQFSRLHRPDLVRQEATAEQDGDADVVDPETGEVLTPEPV